MDNEMNQEMQIKTFSIISYVGDAKSKYVEALRLARSYDFEQADRLMEEGRESFVEGHRIHAEMIAEETGGKDIMLSMLLMHAEALLIDAESTRLNINEFIGLYKLNAEREKYE